MSTLFWINSWGILCCNVYDESISVTVMEFEKAPFWLKKNILDHAKMQKLGSPI
jgi:hypothetical protein